MKASIAAASQELPTELRSLPLGEIAQITMGNSPPGESYNDIGNGIPLINGPVEFSEGAFGLTIKSKYTTSPTKLCKTGDFLICVRGSTTGRTNIAAFDACIGRGVAAIRAREDQRYLNHFLRTLRQKIFDSGHGSTFPSISQEQLSDLIVPLPSLSEQKRIAGILDQADGLRRKRQQALALTDHLAPSIFREMFGSRDSRGLRWSTSTVGDAVNLTNGRAFKSSDWKKEGLPIIRIQNLKNSDASFNYFDGEYDDQHLVEPGALLIAWAGQLVSFGVHLWPGPAGVLNQHIFKVTPKGKYSPVFLHQALSEVIERAKSQFHGIDMKHITKSDLVSHEIPNPPYEMQCEFARRVSVAESIRSRCFTAAKRDEQLFNSLVQRAFRGEL